MGNFQLNYTGEQINERLGRIDSLAKKSELPTKISDLTNDAGFIESSEVPVQSVNGKTGAVTLSASDVGADASGTASSAVSTHNSNTSAHADIRQQINNLNNALDGYIPTSEAGAASGVATLDTAGKVPTSQLPSYVDDVLEYSTKASFPTKGESGKIYIDVSTNTTWRWSGSTYTAIGSDLALGETEGSAYRGDRGKAAYDHSQIKSGNPHGTTISNISGLQTALDNKANKSEGAFYIEGSGTTDSTEKTSTWVGTSDRITGYYNGLAIRYKIGVAGQTTTTLNINNLGAKKVYRFGTTALTTQFPVGSIINLVYHEDLNNGCWMCNDYDANTNTQQRVYESSGNTEYAITTRYNTTDGASYYAEYGRYTNGVTLNPSTNTITATAFKGKLTGNADTATKATKDGDGNVIKDTYAKKSDIPTVPVKSVNGKTGAIVLSPEDVGAVDINNYITLVGIDLNGETHSFTFYGKEDENALE